MRSARGLRGAASERRATTPTSTRAATRPSSSARDGGFDLRRSALPITIGAIAVAVGGRARDAPAACRASAAARSACASTTLTGAVSEWNEGSVFVLPGLQQMRVFSLRDQSWRAAQMSRADGPAPLQSVEGLSLGADLTVRYAIDPLKVAALAKSLPDNVGGEIVEPAAQGVIYKVFARYTVREIFSTKRSEIQAGVETELKPRLAADGVVLRNVQIGKIDLPADYRRGMESLLAEELAGEKMKYTLELKEKQVKETELDGAGREGAARDRRRGRGARAGHRRQGPGRGDEARAAVQAAPDRAAPARGRGREGDAHQGRRGSAQARRIEANGEAEARQKLADAEVYRLDKVGKSNAEQMGREGALITRHPLLIQKTMADKLSDKVQVIIAAPPAPTAASSAPACSAAQRNAVASAATPSSTPPRRREGGAVSTGARCATSSAPAHAADRGARCGAGDGCRSAALAASASAVAGAGRRATVAAHERATPTAIVLRDQTALRAAPRDSAPQQALLWQGEVLEVRGERLDYLQVWDHQRERGGFVRASQVAAPPRRGRGARAAGGARFVRDSAGQRGARHRPGRRLPPGGARRGAARRGRRRGVRRARHLGRPAGAARSRPATRRTRPPRRRSPPPRGGEPLRRPLRELRARRQDARSATTAMPSGASWPCQAEPLQQARAALALTRPECVDPALAVHDRAAPRRVARRRARPRRHRRACPPT